MTVDDAATLIRPAVRRAGETWADLGAGRGTFTLALASLVGPAGSVIAVERDASALAVLRSLARRADGGAAAKITTVAADFTRPVELPALDGALLANALHFVPYADQPRVVDVIAHDLLRPGGRLLLVEYERRDANRWVPFPIAFARFVALARDAGLTLPLRIGERRSAFGGTMYAAVAEKGAR